jgi:hypothetical protein
MKPLDWSYELHVIGTRPKALPLHDFGELVKRFADLLGNAEKVHFGALRPGSARILAKVDEEAHTDVKVQLVSARMQGKSSAKVVRMDEYLCARGWHGEVRNREGNVVLSFPGALGAKQPEEERTVQQIDTLVGQVIKIGGRDESVPMTLETSDGSYVDVNVRGRDLAKRLAPHLFGKEIRIIGLATWKRNAEGEWSCTGMLVDDFEEPDGTPLSELFDSLRELPGNEWNAMDDPIGAWKKLRGDN